MKLEFKAEDFQYLKDAARLGHLVFEALLDKEIAKTANARLTEMLKDAPVVWCRLDNGFWAADQTRGFARATHVARLVNIEEVKG